ncbi:MAG: MFS transporter [Candidatus Riflebacteria bacterium]|nr:MFS transporter [Candidatus Riflebacteria bacterium]
MASYIKSDGKTVLLGVICMLVSSVAHVFPGLIVDFKVFAASLFVSGLTVGLNNVKFVTMFQKIVPQEVKGSFFARMQAIISFTFPIAYLSFGFLSDVIKTPHLCLIQSVGIFFTALWFARLIKKESVIAAELV